MDTGLRRYDEEGRYDGGWRGFWRQERGAGTAFYVLGAMALLVTGAFIVDGMQTTGDAAQVKRATDAAALAVGHQVVTSNESNDDFDQTEMTELAYQYVRANLGMDSKLAANLSPAQVSVSSGRNSDNHRIYTVTLTFDTDPQLLDLSSREQQIHSTVEVRTASLEVALALPNTLSEGSGNLAALRRIGNQFAEDLIGDSDNIWLSLVPYSQAVNVYDADHTNRIRQWASSDGLNPVELTSLFRSGYGSLADRRIPDRRYNLLCMYRGLDQGDNYFWDEAPSSQFRIYYRADLPENATKSYYISWVGPNPTFGQASGVNDTRYMIADKGCPDAAVLPLTNDFDKISARLDEMATGYNTNYAIAMGWAAMTLAPEFRGSSGWGLDDNLPKDFDEGNGERLKAVVLLVNSSNEDWFDVDSYNAYVGEAIDGCPTDGSFCQSNEAIITQRFANLCASFRARDLRFFLVVTGNDESDSNDDIDGNLSDASGFRRIAGAGLSGCAVESTDLTYYNGEDFVASESKITDRLQEIAEELQQESSFVRLIE